MTTPLSSYASVNGFNMHYWEWPGDGPTILFLHPSGFYGRIWEWVAQRLSPEFRVLAIDQRGHGLSEQPQAGNSSADYASDVEGFCQARSLDRLVVAGHSLGARGGMVFAAEHPERTLALVLVGGPHYGTIVPGEDVDYWQQRATRTRERSRRNESIAAARQVIREQYPSYSEAAAEHVAEHNSRRLPDGSVQWHYQPDWVADGLLHATDDLTAYPPKLRCPVLILRTEKSWELTAQRMREVERQFPTASIVTIPNTQLNLELEAPDQVADNIRAFLTSVAISAGTPSVEPEARGL